MTTPPAGPELDRLIAEKVMGWKWDKGQNWYAGSSGFGTSPRTGFWPSTNISHAWEVVKRMIETEGPAWPEQGRPEHEKLHRDYWFHDLLEMTAAEAALAICRAALAALGHE